MGSNDHQPVPDPKPKFPGNMTRTRDLWHPEEPEPTDIQVLADQVALVEKQVEICSDRHNELASCVRKLENTLNGTKDIMYSQDKLNHTFCESVTELKTHLKSTIRAVERLAKGKSLGALGLPSEEDWK